MTAFGLAARWTHLLCGLGLVGIFSASLLAGRSERPTARAWGARTVSLARWLIAAALLSGIATLAYQVVVVSGRESALLDPAIWRRLLTQSRFGAVWLARHGLLVLLLALVVLREREDSVADWASWRLSAGALAAGAAAAMAGAAHAVAVEPLGGLAVFADGLHAVTAGLWLGALLPLALLLGAASRESGADARPYAVLAVRRFSALALLAMIALAGTGLWNAWVEVGSVAGLVGTPYGWLLLVKIALLGPIVALAIVNRRRLLPALGGDGATVGRPAMGRLSRFLALELGFAVLIIGMASALSLSVPGVHDSPRWPFSFRLSFESLG
jgi:copper resistance protein D